MVGLAWGMALLLSFVGWGAVVCRCATRGRMLSWAHRAVIGMSLLICLGGMLNYLAIISAPLLIGLVGAGVIACLWDAWLQRTAFRHATRRGAAVLASKPLIAALWVVVLGLAAVQYVGSAWSDDFNTVDDHHAYLVFPQRMLQTGSMEPAPFSERRIVSSLGGQSWLHAMVLAAGREENYYIIDPGLTVLMLIGLLASMVTRRGGPAALIACFALIALLLPAPQINTTAILGPIVMLLFLVDYLDAGRIDGMQRWGHLFVLCLVAAAAATLKSSLLPGLGLLMIISFAVHAWRSRDWWGTIRDVVLCAAIGLILILPWMLSLKQSAGTLLFPLLGRGYHATAWGGVPTPSSLGAERGVHIVIMTLLSYAYVATAALVAITLAVSRHAWRRRAAAPAMGMAALVGCLLLSWMVAGEGHYRYGYSIYIPAILTMLVVVLTPPQSAVHRGRRAAQGIIAGACVATFVIGSAWNDTVIYYWDFLHNIKVAVQREQAFTDAQRATLRHAQDAVPEGEQLIARVARPFLLDFARNPIVVPDHPGQTSPPPGMPLYAGPEPLAAYLQAQNIRYVMYSYGNEAGFSRRQWGHLVAPGNTKILMGIVAKPLFAFQNNLVELGKTRRRIHDDGHVFVIDLASRADTVDDESDTE